LRRRRAASRACFARLSRDAADLGSRRSAVVVARERRAEGFFFEPLFATSCCARRRVDSEVSPFAGAGSGTPARRAFESAIAIACFVDRAPS
jgi:hypothetical protein